MRYTPKHAAPSNSMAARRTATVVAAGASTLGAGLMINTASAHAATPAISVAAVAPVKAAAVKTAGFSVGTKLSVDGVIGPKTTKAIQKWLGISQTGSLDTRTRKLLQKKVGVAQDGQIGPKTTAAVQRVVGVSKDGARSLNARTVRGVQSYLNNGAKVVSGSTSRDSVRPAAPVTSTAGLNLARAAMWDRIAWCESGRRWNLVASNSTGTYHGGLMMTHDAWRIGGGLAFSYDANQSSREEQITVANNLYAQLGLKPWSCRYAA